MDALSVTFVLLILSWIFYKLTNGCWKKSVQMPGPKGYPCVGSAFELTADNIFEKFYEFAEKFGNMYKIKTFNTMNVVLNTSELVHKAFCGERYKTAFNNKPVFFFPDHFYDGAQTIAFYKDVNDQVHNGLRKALAKSFHVYGEGIPKFESKITLEIQRLREKLVSFQGQEFEVLDLLRVSLSNTVSILLIGEPAEEEDAKAFWELVWHQDFFMGATTDLVLSNFPFLRYVPGTAYKTRYEEVLEAKRKIIDKYFHRMKATRQPGSIRGIVDWYLENQQEDLDEGKEPFMTDTRITNNIVEIVLTGIITTVSVLSCTILCLLNHKEYQAKIQKELDRAVGRERCPILADKRSCQMLEAVMMETQRYLTPAPLLAPHIASRDINFEGYDIKEKTLIFPNVWYIHHDQKLWSDPWVFRPERFLDENAEIVPNTHPYRKSWLPFGTGRRQCPGESLARSRMYLYMAILLQRLTFVPAESGVPPCDPRTGTFDRNITLRPKPFRCRVIERV